MSGKKIKIISRICFGIAIVALIIGASFHGYRTHPEDVYRYNIGVMMGITMITVFGIFLVTGTILAIIGKRKKKNTQV